MRKIILLSLLAFSASVKAQNIASLLTEAWEVEAYYAQHEDYKISFYHKDATDNTETYEGVIYDFLDNGTYNLYESDTLNRESQWEIYSEGDSIRLSGANYKLVSLTEDEFIVSYTGVKFSIPLDYQFVLKPSRIMSTKTTVLKHSLIDVFPIPSTGQLSLLFHTDIANAKSAQLCAIDGRSLKTLKLSNEKQQNLYFTDVKSGMYLLKLISQSGEVVEVKSIVIEH